MPREQVVSAYLLGEISRRTFIRRLVAAGVSVGAAVAYAQLLTPKWAAAAVGTEGNDCVHYDLYDEDLFEEYCAEPPPQQGQTSTEVQVKQEEPPPPPPPPPGDTTAPVTSASLSRLSLATLLLTGRFVIRLRVDEACSVVVGATVNVPGKASAAKAVSVGRGSARFPRAGTKKIVVKLSRRGKATLRRLRDKRRKPTLVVTSKATDAAGNVRTRKLRARLR